MEALALYTGAPTVHWEDKICCISVIESTRVTHRVKKINITVSFLQDKFDNGIFVPKHEKPSDMPEDMCTKPFSGPIISRSIK